MKSRRRASWFLAGFSCLTVLSLISAVSGSLAWYAYSTRVTIAYEGTSVGRSEQLQIGLVDDDNYITNEVISTNKYSRVSLDSHSIVWAPAGGGFVSSVISSYLNNSGIYKFEGDVNSLSPVTSKKRTLADTSNLHLYEAPTSGYSSTNLDAKRAYYIDLPFVFRIIDNNNNYVGGSDVWISDTKVQTSGSQNIHESLRIFIDNPNTKFLFNPSASNSGSTVLAGLLDLNGDGYYDYYRDSGKEIIYGEDCMTGTPTYSATALASDSDLDDINETNYGEATTFYAKHKEGVYTTDYTGLTFDEAHYYGIEDIRPVDDGGGHFTGGKPATTTDETTKLGYATLTIYLEGWDHSVIDQAIGYKFNLGIQFEIDRI